MDYSKEIIHVIGISSAIGMTTSGCEQGPKKLKLFIDKIEDKEKPQLHWLPTFTLDHQASTSKLHHFNKKISLLVKNLCENKNRFLIIGGDHSCAIGTWPGALSHFKKEIGLIWVDAHLDAHTTTTSPSGNIHGMPIAALLGCDDKKLQAIHPNQHYLSSENIVIFGARDFEEEERSFLKKKNITIYDAELISTFNNIHDAFQDAISRLKSCTKIAVSLDIDAVDPSIAPAVTTPVNKGLSLEEVMTLCHIIQLDPRFIGLEIAEFNPPKDKNEKTAKLIYAIVKQIFKSLKTSPN